MSVGVSAEHLCKYLAVRNDKRGLSAQRLQHVFQLISFTTTETASESRMSRIVCCCGKNQAAFWRGFVNGDDEDDKIRRLDQVSDNGPGRAFCRRQGGNAFFSW